MNISGGNKKIKNIRAMIKQPFNSASSHKNKCEKEQLSLESEISFNITPDEEELFKDIADSYKQETTMAQVYQNFCTFNTKEIDEENQNETQTSRIKAQLGSSEINKVKKGTESLDTNKFSERSTVSTSVRPVTRHTTLNNYSFEYNEEAPVDSSRIIRMEKEDLNSKNTVNPNTNTLNMRLLEKIKEIKMLEKENKEKSNTIEKLNLKIDRQHEEIKKLNDRLNAEKHSTLKSEIASLQRKLREKEDELNVKTKIFDNLITEHKNKIENLLQHNESASFKIKEYEAKLKQIKEKEKKEMNENKILDENLRSLEIQFKNLKENFDSCLKEKSKLEDKNKNMLVIINTIKAKLDHLMVLEERRLEEASQLIKKTDHFFIPLRSEHCKMNDSIHRDDL